MKIKVYAICWNEQIIAPHFLKHYKKITDDITIYDNNSTDKTCEILAGLDIRKYDTGEKIRDDVYREIKENAWRECKDLGGYDWVIICDMDEFIYCEDLKGALDKAHKQGYSLIKPTGYCMIGEERLIPNPTDTLYNKITKGCIDNNYSKICIINPNKVEEMNYSIGCHRATPKFEGRLLETNFIKLLHFNFLSLQYAIDRYAIYKDRLSDINIQQNWATHYTYKADKIREEYNMFKSKSINVLELDKNIDKMFDNKLEEKHNDKTGNTTDIKDLKNYNETIKSLNKDKYVKLPPKENVKLIRRTLTRDLCICLTFAYKYYKYNSNAEIGQYYRKQELFGELRQNTNQELYNNITRNYTRLKYWDLLVPMPTSPTEVIYKKGWWGITENGIRFIQKEIALPKYAEIYNDFAFNHIVENSVMINDLINDDELDEFLKL
tara:strand:- start:56614 stop:57924 length:1311 start_codon:yes stop_codon:yes gene_type:complete